MAGGNGAAEGPLKFKPVIFDDIVLGREPEYLVKGIIPANATVVIWGQWKCGKSFWAYDLAMHIARGELYRGKKTVQGPVVYVAMEGDTGLVKRSAAYRLEHLGEEATQIPFYLLTTQMILPDEYKTLEHDLRLTMPNPSFIVLDTLNRSLGGSENKDDDMGRYIQAMDYLRDAFHCTVAVVHHSGNDASKPRGHTSLMGAADTSIKIVKEESQHVASIEFMKDGEAGAEYPFKLKVIELCYDEEGEQITSCVAISLDNEVFERPKKKPGRPRSDKYNRALEKLHDCIVDSGIPLPTNKNVPANTIGVTLEAFSKISFATGVVSPTLINKNSEWSRIVDRLLADRKIAIWNNHVWPVSSKI